MLHLTFFVTLFFACDGKPESGELSSHDSKEKKEYSGIFIGFVNNTPVFFSDDSNFIFTVSLDKIPKVLKKCSEVQKPLFINDSGIIYLTGNGNDFYLIISKNGEPEIKVNLEKPAYSVTATNNLDTLVLCSDFEKEVLKLFVPAQNKILTLPYRGSDPVIILNNVYFSSYIDTTGEGGYSGSNVYMASLKNIDFKELVVKDIFVNFFVSSDGTYIASDFRKENGIKSGIYDTRKRTINYIEKKENYNMAYFSKKENVFVFYSPANVIDNFICKIIK